MFGLDDLALAALVTTGVTSVANLGMDIYNTMYNQDLQERIFNREDNSIARRVADLKAAGMSPVLAAGQGSSAGAIVHTQAPQINGMSDAIQNYMAVIQMKKQFAVQDEQVKNLQSQRKLNDVSSAIKAWDLSKYVESNTASNASGLAKTIRDMFGLSTSTPVKNAIDSVKQKVKEFQQPKERKEMKGGKWQVSPTG